jgi:hypothetical protein
VFFLYDLPQNNYTSTKLAKLIQSKTGYKLEKMPIVIRSLAKPFYTVQIEIDDIDKYQEVAKKLRYFKFEGHPCRGLAYQSNYV